MTRRGPVRFRNLQNVVRLLIGLLGTCLMCMSTFAGAQGLDAALRAIQQDAQAPLTSLSVLAVKEGQVVYEGHFGHRRMESDGPKLGTATNSQTMYRVASISKLVTAIGVMRLVDAGRLDLDADISRYLGFKVRNPNFPKVPITSRMLLSHTSSLRDDAGYVFELNVALRDVLSPQGKLFGKSAAWAPRSTGASAAPGKYFQYVNLNFGVLGTIVEAITHERFDVYLQRTVLNPLGVQAAFIPEGLQQADVDNLAVLYRKGQDGAWNSAGPWVAQTDDFQGKLPAPRPGLDAYVPGTNATGFGPQGGLRISAAGLGAVLQMLMNQGVIKRPVNDRQKSVRILKPASVAAMQRVHWHHTAQPPNGDTLGGEFYAWGLGMQRFTDVSVVSEGALPGGDRLVPQGGVRGYGHAGFAYGLQSLLFYDPEKRTGLVYVSGGSGVDPALHRGNYSSFNQWEERIIQAVYMHALKGTTP